MGPRQGGEVCLFARIMASLPGPAHPSESRGETAAVASIHADELAPCVEAAWTVGCRPRTADDLADFLSAEEASAHLREIGISEDGIEYVIQALINPPSRKVGGTHQQSRVGQIQSYVQSGFRAEPTAGTLQFESSSEHDFAVCVSANPSTLVLIDQPTTVFAPWTTAAGRSRSYQHTPDYLAIYRDKVVVYEVKPLRVLLLMMQDSPHLWSYEDGRFTYLPPYKYFGAMGIVHQVVPSESISWIYAENLRILASHPISDRQPDDSTVTRVRKHVEKHQPTSLAALVDKLRLTSGTHILRAILDGQVFVDLHRCSLWDPENMVICGSEADARHVGTAVQALAAESTSGRDVAWLTCHPKHLPLVGLRLAIATGADTSDVMEINKRSKRTHERVKKSYREQGLRGLFPKWANCGRKPKFSGADTEFALSRIRLDRASTNHESVQQSYAKYKIDLSDAAAAGTRFQLIGLSTYYALWNSRRHNAGDAYGAGGRRKAMSDSPYGDPLDQKPLCTLPLQVAHSDHCSLPVLCAESDKPPTLSSLLCHANKEVLAAVVRFAPGSTTTLALLMRQCGRKHGYLPRYIYSDCGADYRGKQFIVAMAELGICVVHRPPANARAGSEIERYHWTIQETAIRGGTGFVPTVKTRRGVSSSHQPENLPKRKLRDLVADINIAVDMINDGSAYDGDGANRIDLRTRSESIYGPQGIPCTMDFRFLVCTSPFIKDISGKTEPRGAIRWRDRRYYSQVLVGRSLSAAKLHPRLDPESSEALMYFWLDGRWHAALCRELLVSAGRTIESILLEAAHDCEVRRDAGSLAPLHEAMETSRRARAADDADSMLNPSATTQQVPVVSSDHLSVPDINQPGISSTSSAGVVPEEQLDQTGRAKDGGVASRRDLDDWDGIDAIEIHDGGGL